MNTPYYSCGCPEIEWSGGLGGRGSGQRLRRIKEAKLRRARRLEDSHRKQQHPKLSRSVRGPRFVEKDKEKICFNCGKVGHMGYKCDQPKTEHFTRFMLTKPCYKCDKIGHTRQDCDQPNLRRRRRKKKRTILSPSPSPPPPLPLSPSPLLSSSSELPPYPSPPPPLSPHVEEDGSGSESSGDEPPPWRPPRFGDTGAVPSPPDVPDLGPPLWRGKIERKRKREREKETERERKRQREIRKTLYLKDEDQYWAREHEEAIAWARERELEEKFKRVEEDTKRRTRIFRPRRRPGGMIYGLPDKDSPVRLHGILPNPEPIDKKRVALDWSQSRFRGPSKKPIRGGAFEDDEDLEKLLRDIDTKRHKDFDGGAGRSDDWTCKACTFDKNEIGRSRCNMCKAKKPVSDSQPMALSGDEAGQPMDLSDDEPDSGNMVAVPFSIQQQQPWQPQQQQQHQQQQQPWQPQQQQQPWQPQQQQQHQQQQQPFPHHQQSLPTLEEEKERIIKEIRATPSVSPKRKLTLREERLRVSGGLHSNRMPGELEPRLFIRDIGPIRPFDHQSQAHRRAASVDENRQRYEARQFIREQPLVFQIQTLPTPAEGEMFREHDRRFKGSWVENDPLRHLQKMKNFRKEGIAIGAFPPIFRRDQKIGEKPAPGESREQTLFRRMFHLYGDGYGEPLHPPPPRKTQKNKKKQY